MNITKIKLNDQIYNLKDEVSGYATQTYVNNHHDSTKQNVSSLETDVAAKGFTKNAGTVTSVTAGTGLSGGSITGSGTISLSSATQTSLGKADTAVQPATLNNYYTSAQTDNAINAAIGLAIEGAY